MERIVEGPAGGKDRTRVLILGGGFGGVWTAIHLDRAARREPLDITLVSRNNYFLMTPFLFEAGSGVLDPRHVANPIRRFLRRTRFIEAEVSRVDLDARTVSIRHRPGGPWREVSYDVLVLALGGVTHRGLIPGSENALAFKTLADAIFLRNHVIDLFERVGIEEDPHARRALLTFTVIGGGLVGVELIAELNQFVENLRRVYPGVAAEEISFHLFEAGPVIIPEMERDQADYASRSLAARGIQVFTGTRVESIGKDRLILEGGKALRSETIVLAAGIAPSPLTASLDLPKDRKGRVMVGADLRSSVRPEVWALGDCASVPDPEGKPYPALAQHALRQARVLAGNILAARRGGTLRPFIYRSLGMLAALGHYRGVGRVLRLKLRGFPAWWVWRTYYLFQMPRLERKLRIILDWTIALFFHYDLVKLDLFGEAHPTGSPRETAEAPSGK